MFYYDVPEVRVSWRTMPRKQARRIVKKVGGYVNVTTTPRTSIAHLHWTKLQQRRSRVLRQSACSNNIWMITMQCFTLPAISGEEKNAVILDST